MQDFHFVMKSNKASPLLMLACATGKHIKKATLTCRKAGGEQQEFLEIKFTDLLVSSFQIGRYRRAATSFRGIRFRSTSARSSRVQAAEGRRHARRQQGGWDLKANKKV